MFIWKTRLDNSPKTRRFLEKKKKVYLVGYWARAGIMEFYYSGKSDKDGMPLVWDYYDGNGTCDCWILCRLDHTTTGQILAWTFDKEKAEAEVEFYRSFKFTRM